MTGQTPKRQWFQPGDGIAREVITADIQRYLGPDALVRPGRGTAEYEGVEGYYITAYRTLTSEMVQDLKLDSQRWRDEVQARQTRVAYQDSQTHQARQHYGPTTPAPEHHPLQPRDPYASSPHPAADYRHPQAGYEAVAYGYPNAPAQPYPAGGQYPVQPGYGAPVTQPRTYPNYTQPLPGGDPAYYHQAPADPRAYPYSNSSAQPRDPVYAPPPSTQPPYYPDQRGPYQSTPPQANTGRRRP